MLSDEPKDFLVFKKSRGRSPSPKMNLSRMIEGQRNAASPDKRVKMIIPACSLFGWEYGIIPEAIQALSRCC